MVKSQAPSAISRVELAAALGLSPASVTALAYRGMPTTNVEAAKQWRRENVRRRVLADDDVDPPAAAEAGVEDFAASRARKEAAEASLAELKLEEQRERLVDRGVVSAEHAKRVVQFRDAMLQIPARLSPLLVGQDDQGRIERLIDAELRQALVVFSGGADGS